MKGIYLVDISPEVKEKVSAAADALAKYKSFLPGAVNVFFIMMNTTIFTGKHLTEGGLSGVFATVSEADIKLVHTALEAVLAERSKVIASENQDSSE